MKTYAPLIVSCLMAIGLLTSCSGADGADRPAATTQPGQAAPFALVELFTSEGCSSCPPADALVGKLRDEAEKSQSRVFFVAFHVDYWNDLGWRDPFSDAAYSKRQRNYAAALKDRGPYTPQMIVNGTAAFVGSNAKRARGEIRAALAHSSAASVELGAAGHDRDVVVRFSAAEINRESTDALSSSVIHVAIVQRNATIDVADGENSGRQLDHFNVVRAFATMPIDKSGAGEIKLTAPDDVNLEEATVVGWVQKAGGTSVLGAAQAPIAIER